LNLQPNLTIDTIPQGHAEKMAKDSQISQGTPN